MKSNKKGQAAMEFLMTYGWAILVVLAAIAALAYFGVLSPDRWLPTKCTISGGFSCTDYKVTLSGSLPHVYFEYQNNLGVDATNVSVTFVGTQGCSGNQTTAAVSLGNGASQTFNYDCASGSSSTGIGDRVKGTISISYQRSGQSTSHIASGDITTKVES